MQAALITFGVLIAALFILAANRPDTFRIQRSTTINANAGTVFALIEDFHLWSGWSGHRVH